MLILLRYVHLMKYPSSNTFMMHAFSMCLLYFNETVLKNLGSVNHLKTPSRSTSVVNPMTVRISQWRCGSN